MFLFSIVIPFFNEEKNVLNLIEEINHTINKPNLKFELIAINDGSTDNTLKILNKIKNNFNFKILVINNKKNNGQSYSIYKGIKYSKYNTVITIDGDGQNDPKDINIIIKKYFEEDNIKLVGGIRLKRADNKIKIISSRIANNVRKRIFNDNCDDTGCSLKIFDKNIFLTFPFFNGIHRFIPALFTATGSKTMFIPVNHRKRIFGNSKYGTFLRLINGIRDIYKVKKIIKKMKNNNA